MGCGTVVFILNMSRLGCIPTEREGERERGLEGEGVSFSILCSPENPIMKRQSTKSSEPATETKGPFIQEREQHWGKSATQHAMRSTAPPLPLQSDLSVYIKKKKRKEGDSFSLLHINSVIKMKDSEASQPSPPNTQTHTHLHTLTFKAI